MLIVRHAEKPLAGTDLTAAGAARARAYVGYFRRLRLAGKPVHLDVLVAAADTANSNRPRLTLTPLGAALRLSILQPFDSEDVGGLADWLRHHATGRTVLVAWHHSDIADLIAALTRPNDVLPGGRWPSDMYDRVVVLRFDARGRPIPAETQLLREDIAI